MRKSFLLFVMFCLFALLLVKPTVVHRGDIPHFPPCHPNEVMGSDQLCYCNPVMDCQIGSLSVK